MSRACTSQNAEGKTSHWAQEGSCRAQRTMTGRTPWHHLPQGSGCVWVCAFRTHSTSSLGDLVSWCSRLPTHSPWLCWLCTESLSWPVPSSDSSESIYGLCLTQISINSQTFWEARHISPRFPKPSTWFGKEQLLSFLGFQAPWVQTEITSPTLLSESTADISEN